MALASEVAILFLAHLARFIESSRHSLHFVIFRERSEQIFMSQKAEKPTLSGQRLKTRKRDEKEKYDPTSFRDTVVQGLNETGYNLEQVSKYLDSAGSRLDYRRYAEVLFDILFAGGQLAPGGFIVEDSQDPSKVTRTNVCLFGTEASVEKIKAYYEVFVRLIRRYKYLEKSFEDELKKIILFLKGFKDEERTKLAIMCGIILANGLSSAKILAGLFEDHLVKEGLSLEFAVTLFETWLKDRDISNICSALKKAGVESRLLELFPVNKRSVEGFSTYFKEKGLPQIANLQKAQQASQVKKELQKQLADMLSDEAPAAEMATVAKDYIQKNSIPDTEAVILVWNTLMSGVEWNKKDDLVAEQALKHLRAYTLLLSEVTQTGNAELALLLKVQEYCYDNMNFMNSFQKIVLLLYKTEVLSEDVILSWYRDRHGPKGKTVFLEQMAKFVEWLQNAEEESDEDED